MAGKGRSPKYPRINLKDAIKRVNKVYQAERTHRADKEIVAKDLGYGGLNGASVSLIGTLKSYGLLHEDKDGVRVTEDAVALLMAPEDSPERAEAFERAIFAPKVFADLREAYGENLNELPSETNMRYYLLKKGFLENAAAEAIRTYRDNLELVSEEETEYGGAEQVDEQPVEAQVQTQQTASVTPVAVEQEPFTEALQYRISGDSRVRLLFDGAVTREAIEKLMAYLELAKEDYPSRDQLAQPVVEEPNIIEMPETE